MLSSVRQSLTRLSYISCQDLKACLLKDNLRYLLLALNLTTLRWKKLTQKYKKIHSHSFFKRNVSLKSKQHPSPHHQQKLHNTNIYFHFPLIIIWWLWCPSGRLNALSLFLPFRFRSPFPIFVSFCPELYFFAINKNLQPKLREDIALVKSMWTYS